MRTMKFNVHNDCDYQQKPKIQTFWKIKKSPRHDSEAWKKDMFRKTLMYGNPNPYEPRFLQLIFVTAFCVSGVQLMRGVFHLDISSICWFRVIRVVLYVLHSLHRWRCWGVRDKWSRDTATYTTDGIFEHDPDICLFHWRNSLLIKRKTSSLRNTLLKK
jgi:hypothetical protein